MGEPVVKPEEKKDVKPVIVDPSIHGPLKTGSATPTPAVKAYGSTLAYATVTSGTVGSYTTIAYTIDLSSPDVEVGDIKITNNSSPNNTHEYMPGMYEGGTTEHELIYTKAQAASLYALMDATTIYSWQETYPDNSTWVWTGYVKKFGTEGKTDDGALTCKMSTKVCTKPVFTAGS